MKRILVTGAGGSPATNFVRSLRLAPEPFHLAGTDSDKYCLMRAETDTRYLVPRVSDPDYLAVVNQIIAAEGIEAVHVQNDAELEYLSEHREELHARTFFPAKETVRICQDKFRSFEVWREAGIKVPETRVVRTDADLVDAFERSGGELWLRATTGAGGRGALAVRSLETARNWLDLQHGWSGDFTASELLEPTSVTWMSVWWRGELVVAQARRRLYWELSRTSPSGVTGITGAGVTLRDAALDDIAMRCVRSIDPEPHGLFGVDLALDSAGVPNPTEINIGRFFTTHLFFTELGLNLPYIFVKLGYGEAMPPVAEKLSPVREGMVWIRGVDFEPVLVSELDIEENVAELEATLTRLRG